MNPTLAKGAAKGVVALVVAAGGSGFVLADSIMPASASTTERLGTAGVIVLILLGGLRYFMKRLEEKDALIREMTDHHAAALLQELKDSARVREQLAVALHELSDAQRELTRAVRPKR